MALRFPLEDQERYKATVNFQVWGTIPPTFDEKLGVATKEALRAPEGGTPGQDVSLQDVANVAGKIVKKSRQYYTGQSCSLYLPQSIQVADGVQIENVNLGVFGLGLQNAISSGTAPIAAAIEQGTGAISSLLDAFKGNLNSDVARVAATRLAGVSDVAAAAVSSSLQTTPNPNTRSIFKSVNIREFTFDFKFVPKSQREALEIQNIVHFFRRNLYPETITVEGFPIAYKFPPLFKAQMYYGNQRMPKDLNLLDMYLRAVQTNYNPSAMAFYKDGKFQETNMTLSFVESRALTFEDVSKRSFEENSSRENAENYNPGALNAGGR